MWQPQKHANLSNLFGCSEMENEVSGHPSMRYVETSIDIEKDLKKKEREEEKESPGVSPQTPSSSEKIELDHSFPSDSSKEEKTLQEPQTQKEKDSASEEEKREENSFHDHFPPFLEDQMKAREERQKRKLSHGALRKEGLTDEEIRLIFGNRIEPGQYRELIRGKTHREVLNIQSRLMTEGT